MDKFNWNGFCGCECSVCTLWWVYISVPKLPCPLPCNLRGNITCASFRLRPVRKWASFLTQDCVSSISDSEGNYSRSSPAAQQHWRCLLLKANRSVGQATAPSFSTKTWTSPRVLAGRVDCASDVWRTGRSQFGTRNAITVWFGSLKQVGNPSPKPNVQRPGFLVTASDSCWGGLSSKILCLSELKSAKAINASLWENLECLNLKWIRVSLI